MRGKIIQYNGADGSGTIVADGKQYRFALAAWRGDSAPAVNKTVEITLEGDAVTAVALVGDDVLFKEKTAEMGDKLGSLWNKTAASVQARSAAKSPGEEAAPGTAAVTGTQPVPVTFNIPGLDMVRARYGTVIPIAWFLFLIGTLVFNAYTMETFGMSHGFSMFYGAGDMIQGGGGGFLKFLLIVAYLGIAVPMFWRNRRAWLLLLVPLIAVLWDVYSKFHVLYKLSNVNEQAKVLSAFIASSISPGFGLWLSLITAIVLAVIGVKRFRMEK